MVCEPQLTATTTLRSYVGIGVSVDQAVDCIMNTPTSSLCAFVTWLVTARMQTMSVHGQGSLAKHFPHS